VAGDSAPEAPVLKIPPISVAQIGQSTPAKQPKPVERERSIGT